jgi:predicted  nucleic acid-binding Zn-ribbon protein
MSADEPHKHGDLTMELLNTIKGKKPAAEQLAERVKEARSAVAKTQSELDQAEASAVAAVADNDAYANARGEVAAIRARLTEQSELLDRLRSAHKNQFEAEQADFLSRLETQLEKCKKNAHDSGVRLNKRKQELYDELKRAEAAVELSWGQARGDLARTEQKIALVRAGVPEPAILRMDELRRERSELGKALVADDEVIRKAQQELSNAKGVVDGGSIHESNYPALRNRFIAAGDKLAKIQADQKPSRDRLTEINDELATLAKPPQPL